MSSLVNTRPPCSLSNKSSMYGRGVTCYLVQPTVVHTHPQSANLLFDKYHWRCISRVGVCHPAISQKFCNLCLELFSPCRSHPVWLPMWDLYGGSVNIRKSSSPGCGTGTKRSVKSCRTWTRHLPRSASTGSPLSQAGSFLCRTSRGKTLVTPSPPLGRCIARQSVEQI